MQNYTGTHFFSAVEAPALLMIVLACATPVRMRAQSRRREDQAAPALPFTLSESLGPAIPVGKTGTMTTPGAALVVGVAGAKPSRLAYSFNTNLIFSGVPKSILQQAGQPNGEEDYLSFNFDPVFTFVKNRRWGAYVTGGGGISFKRVVFLRPSPVCTYDYGCYAFAGSESSWQPSLDVGAGVTWRIHPKGKAELFEDTRYLDMFTPQGQFPGFNSAGTRFSTFNLGLRF